MPTPGRRNQITLDLLEHWHGQHCRSRGEVVDAVSSRRRFSWHRDVVKKDAESNQMYQKTVAELRLEPRRLGRHDRARVGSGHEIVEAHGI